jgi:hypothetical protein
MARARSYRCDVLEVALGAQDDSEVVEAGGGKRHGELACEKPQCPC